MFAALDGSDVPLEKTMAWSNTKRQESKAVEEVHHPIIDHNSSYTQYKKKKKPIILEKKVEQKLLHIPVLFLWSISDMNGDLVTVICRFSYS